MTHFGIISPPVFGHIHPLAALARELIARGHQVTCLQMADLEEKILSEGVGFQVIGQSDHPRGTLPRSLAQIARLSGLSALRFTVRAVERTSRMVCRDAPAAIRGLGIEALLVDQMEPAGGAVAEHLELPFVTICNALAINRDALAPPPFSPWRYRDSGWARLRNRLGYAVSAWWTRPVSRAVAGFRKAWRLPALGSPDESFSRVAQICQMPRAFDFPRSDLPACFHYVGPLRGSAASAVPFPWERLRDDGRPIVYASLGTLQNRREALFRCFAEACRGLDVQLVISHGGGLTEREAGALPGDPLVVPYAPQTEVLARAAVTITHAGLNTVLDSLSQGVPMLAVPITYEQPAIARRVEWTGAGGSIALPAIRASAVRSMVRELLSRAQYRAAARRMAASIRDAGGTRRAADIVEAAVA